MIDSKSLTEAEHQVVEVEEPIPDVYVPVDMFDKDMFDGQFSRYEVCLMAALLKCEGGGMSFETLVDIVSVVFNRWGDPDFPNTIEEVIYQKGQYEPALKGTINKYIDLYYYNNADGFSEEALLEAEEVFEAVAYVCVNGSQLPPEVVYQSPFKQGSGVYKVSKEGEIFSYK